MASTLRAEEPQTKLTSQTPVAEVNAVASQVATDLMTLSDVAPGGALTSYALSAVSLKAGASIVSRYYAGLHQLTNSNLAFVVNSDYMLDTRTGDVFEISLTGEQGAGSLTKVTTFARSQAFPNLYYNQRNWIYRDEDNQFYLWNKN